MNQVNLSECKLTDVSGTTTLGRVEIADLSSHERLLRAAKRASVFFAIAVVTVAVPMLHFVLVPAFLILSAYVFAKTISETRIVTRIDAACPACKKTLRLEGSFKFSGTKEVCPECRQVLKISFTA